MADDAETTTTTLDAPGDSVNTPAGTIPPPSSDVTNPPAAGSQEQTQETHEEPPTEPEALKTWNKEKQKRDYEAAQKRKQDQEARERKRDEELAELRKTTAESQSQIKELLTILAAGKQPAPAAQQAKDELEEIEGELDLAEKVARGEAPEDETRSAVDIQSAATRRLVVLQRKEREDRKKADQAAEARNRESQTETQRRGSWETTVKEAGVSVEDAQALVDEAWRHAYGQKGLSESEQRAAANAYYAARFGTLKKSSPNSNARTTGKGDGGKAPANARTEPVETGARPESVQQKEANRRFFEEATSHIKPV